MEVEAGPTAEADLTPPVPARGKVPPVPQSAPEVTPVLTPTSGVAAPMFVAPPASSDDEDDDGDLRLFE